MKAWRAVLAMGMVMGALFGAFCLGSLVKSPIVQVFGFFVCADVALLGICFSQSDGIKRGKPESKATQ